MVSWPSQPDNKQLPVCPSPSHSTCPGSDMSSHCRPSMASISTRRFLSLFCIKSYLGLPRQYSQQWYFHFFPNRSSFWLRIFFCQNIPEDACSLQKLIVKTKQNSGRVNSKCPPSLFVSGGALHSLCSAHMLRPEPFLVPGPTHSGEPAGWRRKDYVEQSAS